LFLEKLACMTNPVFDYDRVDFHLFNWARYMRTGSYAGLSLPGRACAGMGISHSADFDQLADQSDRVAARAVDAIIRDLKPLEAKAIRCSYLGEEWTSKLQEAAVLVVAKESVRAGLARKGMV
jgi:hypothetical protein